MMKKVLAVILLLAITLLLLPDALFADPRTQIVKFIIGKQIEENITTFGTNFFSTMDNVIIQVRASGYGLAATGIEPNRVNGMAHCYGDLSSVDCVLCCGSMRGYLPRVYPATGGMFYLDGCFARIENYSFFHEYAGANDQAICGNITRQDPRYHEATRQALSHVVSTAPNRNGYARAQVAVAGATNLSVYVLADCWRTISATNCRACLKNALASLSGCFPASEGRALNSGCFVRYSDANFLNPIPPRRRNHSRGKLVVVIVVSAVSAAAILIIGAVIGVNMLKNRMIQKRREDSSKGKALNWEKRFEIIIGTAEGLVHLHENTKTRIIHRDIKASNILLDSRFCAKIADFGLARTFQEEKSHISTAIAGTLGYMAPEYLAHGRLTEKADVYSFGVLLLEIVTGTQNNKSKSTETEYTDSLLTIAWKHFQQGTVEELFDPNLMLHYYRNINKLKNEILRVVHVALLCTQENPTLRPSVSEALLMLVKNDQPLPAPTNPPFLDDDTMELNDVSSSNVLLSADYGNDASIAIISHSIFYPR